jgi:hypothetical protein
MTPQRFLSLGLLVLSFPAAATAATLYADPYLCPLGDAIQAANTDTEVRGCSAGSGSDIIFVGYSVDVSSADTLRSSVIEGSHAAFPDVTSDVTIVPLSDDWMRRSGSECTASTSDDFRFFNVTSGGRLRLNGLSMVDGCASGAIAGGGAVAVVGEPGSIAWLGLSGLTLYRNGAIASVAARGGAIVATHAEVMLGGVTFIDNEARGVESAGAGGGALHLIDSRLVAVSEVEFWGNQAVAGAGGDASGGALLLGGDACGIAAIDGMHLSDNTARGGDSDAEPGGRAAGGAMALVGPCVVGEIRRLELRFNRAIGGSGLTAGGTAVGGGLSFHGEPGAALLRLSIANVQGNQALAGDAKVDSAGSAEGGGLALRNVAVGSITASAFAGNSAIGGDVGGGSAAANSSRALGAGLFVEGGTVALLSNVSLSGNSAIGGTVPGSSGGGAAGGAAWFSPGGGSRLSHVTAWSNQVSAGPASSAGAGGLVLRQDPLVDNLLLADNVAAALQVVDWDVEGAVQSGGFNHFEADRGASGPWISTDLQALVDGLGISRFDRGCQVPLPGGDCIPVVQLLSGSNMLDRGSCAASGITVDAWGTRRPRDVETAAAADDGCDPGAFEFNPGILELAVDMDPDGPWYVEAYGSLGVFALDDDADPVLPAQRRWEVPSGAFEVWIANRHEFAGGWTCADPSADSGNAWDGRLTAVVAPGETVRCTFDVAKRTLVRVVQETSPTSPLPFSFSGIQNFTLVDDSYWDTEYRDFDVSVGTHAVIQQSSPNEDLDSIECDDPTGGTSSDTATRTATLGVAAHDTVTCTFRNSVNRGFFTTPPCRVLDTRLPVSQPLTSYDSQHWVYLIGKCGIPVSASAVAFNLTAVAPTTAGSLSVDPYSGGTLPVVHFQPAQTRAGFGVAAVYPLFSYYWEQLRISAELPPEGQVHVVLDIYGYFQDPPP